jgi:hypothetical protein
VNVALSSRTGNPRSSARSNFFVLVGPPFIHERPLIFLFRLEPAVVKKPFLIFIYAINQIHRTAVSLFGFHRYHRAHGQGRTWSLLLVGNKRLHVTKGVCGPGPADTVWFLFA